MKIVFLPEQHMNSVTHVLSGLVWSYGEVKDIPDDEKIRVNVAGQSIYVNLVDDLLSNPAYRCAGDGKNPNYTCSICGDETTAEGFSDELTAGTKLFEIDGKRVCVPCFKSEKNAIPVPDPDPINEE